MAKGSNVEVFSFEKRGKWKRRYGLDGSRDDYLTGGLVLRGLLLAPTARFRHSERLVTCECSDTIISNVLHCSSIAI